MATSRARIEAALQHPVVHRLSPMATATCRRAREFALARSLGFKTAVTTRPGMLFAENARISRHFPGYLLNGNYQDAHPCADLLCAVWNGFRRVDAAA